METRQKIREKVLHWEDRGFKYQRHGDGYIEDVCEWIDVLLGEYGGTSDSQYVGMEYVEEYLKECLDYYKEDSFETMAEISSLSNMASPKDIYRLLEKVEATWKDIAEPGKECVEYAVKGCP